MLKSLYQTVYQRSFFIKTTEYLRKKVKAFLSEPTQYIGTFYLLLENTEKALKDSTETLIPSQRRQ